MRMVTRDERRRLTILPAVLRIHALARRSRRGGDGPARAERRRGLVRRTNQGRAVGGVRVRPKSGRWAAAHRKALLGVVCCLGRGSLSRGVRVAASHGCGGGRCSESEGGRRRRARGGDRISDYCMLREEYSVVGRVQGERRERAARAAGGGGRRRTVTRELCSQAPRAPRAARADRRSVAAPTRCQRWRRVERAGPR